MHIFSYIILNNIAPLFLLILLGYLLENKFGLDIRSFSKVSFYIFIPSLILVKVYETHLNLELLKVLVFGILFLLSLSLVSYIITKIRGYNIAVANAFKNSILFYNSGNFGLPLISLVFKYSPLASLAISMQIMILMLQNFISNTVGFFNAGRGQMEFKETLFTILKMPAIYALTTALILKTIPWDATSFFLWPALNYMKDGMIPIALITLGIQLSQAKINLKDFDVYIASFTRLIGGPLLALLLIYVMHIQGVMAQVLLISSSVPTSVSSALIAVEFNNEPDFASQVVMTTTLLSPITITIIIYLSQVLF